MFSMDLVYFFWGYFQQVKILGPVSNLSVFGLYHISQKEMVIALFGLNVYVTIVTYESHDIPVF